MNWTAQRQRFRALLAGTRCVHPASVADPLSARVAEMLEFEVGIFAGSLGALSVLAAPDMTLITLSEFAEQAYRICRASSLPIMVDADHGYGNALNVMRTVQELETAGVALVLIEDTVLPREYGAKGKQLVSIDEAVGKFRAALSARQDPNLIVAGRTQAARILSMPELLERVRAYAATGIEALFLGGVKTRAQVEAVASVVNIPLLLGSVPPELMDLEYLAAHKVRTCNPGHLPIRAAVHAYHETMKAMRSGVSKAEIPNLASDELMDRVTRAADYAQWTREFLDG